ncbi:Dabb family protein [Demequina sp.]|uniref:Dabb family protein n=1 Tax=Demequina sp. TaxID=2050685 RepID=UPI0025C0FC21|nr:Dabb family protein [Demequina sp.]
MSTSGNIVHVVLTEWRADAPAEALAQMRELARRFPAEIPGVVSVVEGASVSTEGLEAGYDWALVVTFESAAARDGYLPHPAHKPVAAVIGEWAERLVVFDLDA